MLCRILKGSKLLNLTKRFKSTVNYEEAIKKLPGPSLLSLVLNHFPGGKYHNMQVTDLNVKLKEEFGSVVRIPGMFGEPDIVLIYEAKDHEKILRNEGKFPVRNGFVTLNYYRKHFRKEIFAENGSMATDNHEMWYKARSITNKLLLPPKSVQLHIPKVDEIAMEFMSHIDGILDDNNETPDDFLDCLNRWSLESIGCIALDTRLEVMGNKRQDLRAERMTKLGKQIFILCCEFEIFPSIWRFYQTRKFKELMSVYDEFTEIMLECVEDSLKRCELNKKADDEMGIVEKISKFDKNLAITIASDMLIAGVDSTAATLCGLLYCLAKNPEKQELLRKEVLEVLPERDSKVTAESMKSLPYLRAAMKESLRLYSVVAGTTRMIPNDMVFQGHLVPANTNIVLLMMGNQLDAKHFKKPAEFIPDRWIKTNNHYEKLSNQFAYLPFGFGARQCIGKRYAELEIEIFIIRLLRKYRIEWHHSDLQFKSVLINIPDGKLKFKLTKL